MSFLFKGKRICLAVLLSGSFYACGSPDEPSSQIQGTASIGFKSMWKAEKSFDGRLQIVYCPINAGLPKGYYASKLAGDCASLQGGQPSGVTALMAQEIRASDKVLCLIKNAEYPSGWKAQKGPFGTVNCGASGIQIERL